jgi:hypothetical protein
MRGEGEIDPIDPGSARRAQPRDQMAQVEQERTRAVADVGSNWDRQTLSSVLPPM